MQSDVSGRIRQWRASAQITVAPEDCGQGGERCGKSWRMYRNWNPKLSSLKHLAGRMSFKNYLPAIKRIMNSLFDLAFSVERDLLP